MIFSLLNEIFICSAQSIGSIQVKKYTYLIDISLKMIFRFFFHCAITYYLHMAKFNFQVFLSQKVIKNKTLDTLLAVFSTQFRTYEKKHICRKTSEKMVGYCANEYCFKVLNELYISHSHAPQK